MSRVISNELKAHFASEVLTICTCVKIEREDGTVMGFTNIDTFDYDGVTYHSANSVRATAISASLGSGVDNLDMDGVIDSDYVTAEDILGGKYKDAKVEVFRLNYEDHSMGRIVTFTGRFGSITVVDKESYVVELLSLSHLLKSQVGDVTCATCRVRKFGDNQCKVDMTGRTHTKAVVTVTSEVELEFGSTALASGYFNYGVVEFTSGNNEGISREVKMHTLSSGKAVISLRRAFPFAVEVGDTAVLTQGCSRLFTDCVSKFDNAINFRGEPHLPGSSKLVKVGRISQ